MNQWIRVCQLSDILPETGVCALVEGEQIALFRPYADEQVYALSNIDPFFEASVLSRGLIAEHNNELWITSPLKKQHFRLADGHCLEDESRSIAYYEARVEDGFVYIKA